MIRSEPVAPESYIAAGYALLHMRQGSMASVQRWVERIRHVDVHALSATTTLTLARVVLHQGREQEAIAIAHEVLAKAESEGRWGAVVETQVLLAVGKDILGSGEAATQALLQAMALAQKSGYVRTFVDGGKPVVELLRGLARTGQLSAYGIKLLGACEGIRQADDAADGAKLAAQALVEPLSERELEVLHLIAQGYTNKEIAGKLYLSTGTVKVHAHNIYSKLGVSGRTKAVAMARELGLLL